MDEISAALISLAVSTAASLVVCFLGYRQNVNQHYSVTISNERVAWIKETRKVVAEFLSLCEAYDELTEDNAEKFNRLKNEILLNLNSNQNEYPKDAVIRAALLKKDFAEIKKSADSVRNSFADIFKSEWDKSKLEAGRSKYHVMKLEIKARDLAEYFENRKG